MENVCQRLKNIDALLVSNYFNIFYLTRFKGLSPEEREAYLLVTKKNNYLFTDGRYFNKLKVKNEKLKVKLITPDKGLLFHLIEIVKNEQIKTLGFEGEDLKYVEYQKLKEQLTSIELIPTEKIIINMRAIKNDKEIINIKKACQLTDNCLREIIKTIKINQTEKEIAYRLEVWLKEKDHDLAFDPIVAIDKNSSLPHYDTKTGYGTVKNNSIILIDFGAKYNNYLADITRMIFVNAKDAEINIYNKLLAAQKKTITQLNKKNNAKEIDNYCRQLLIKQNLPIHPHSTGHGVGLEIHEYPKISQVSTDMIYNNQVFTIEPGIYFENKWGMRIEDTVLIKNSKCKVLTNHNKDLISLAL